MTAEILDARELGAGPTLVMINGYASTKEDWDPTFIDALAAESSLVCTDNRGMGGSPGLDGELSIASMAGDVLALMDARGIDQADVLGWSMGGFVAQLLAATAPARVRRLVLLSTDPGGEGSTMPDPAVWSQMVDLSGTPREQATRLISLLFPPDVAKRIDVDFGEFVAAARAALPEDVMHAQEAAMSAWHLEPGAERVRSIRAPTLVAAGTQDVAIPPANSEQLAKELPESRLELFEGGGHAFMAQEPEKLAALINEWLGR